jgi:hypothetical protein
MVDLYYMNQTLPRDAVVLARIETAQELEDNAAAVRRYDSESDAGRLFGKTVTASLSYARRQGWGGVVIVETKDD